MKIIKWGTGTVDQSDLSFIGLGGSWQKAWLQAKDTTGKHYFEALHLSGAYIKSGIYTLSGNNYWYLDDNRGGCWGNPGGSVVTPAYPALARLMVAYDLDVGKVWFGANGTWWNSGDPVTGANPIYSNLLTIIGAVDQAYPCIEAINGYSGRFLVDPADWLYAPSGYTPPTYFDSYARAMPFPLRRDMEDGGPLSIVEPVTRLNAVPPQSRRVRLHDQRSGRLVREQWSDPTTGEVDFQYLREGPWILYALDHTGEHEAVAISDRLATVDGSRP